MTDFDLTNPDELPFGEWPREAQLAFFDAHLNGEEIEVLDGRSFEEYWREIFDTSSLPTYIYRLKPQSHELQIPDIAWQFFDKAEWAAMDADGSVWVYAQKPEKFKGNWASFGAKSCVEFEAFSITIPTDGIDWRKSLTKRPEGV